MLPEEGTNVGTTANPESDDVMLSGVEVGAGSAMLPSNVKSEAPADEDMVSVVLRTRNVSHKR